MSLVEITDLRPGDPVEISAAFAAIGWHKPPSQYEGYLAEQAAGTRAVLVARLDDGFAGYLTLCWCSGYPPFRESGIPEIQDLNVLPHARGRGIASRLLDEAEARAARRSTSIGIGVGLYADYGPAQALYVRRGYVPDGRGIALRGQRVNAMDLVRVDDDLALYVVKRLPPAPAR